MNLGLKKLSDWILAKKLSVNQRWKNCVSIFSSFSFSSVNFEQINSIICDIRNKSPGIEELSVTVFKDNLDIFGLAVVDIVNKSLAQGIFPSELKMAKIVPIYKSGEKDKIENYRPVSLLPVFSKILEKSGSSANRKLSNK